MKEFKVLKKEGIELVSTLDENKVKSISEKVSKKICKAFPEHHLNQHDIYTELIKTNMYFADFNTNNVGAKYYYKNQSMYFNRSFSTKKLSDVTTHECIHFIQERRTRTGNISRFGLYNLKSLKPSGNAINEAAVQLMTVKANKTKPDYVKYFGLDFYTPSPDYYPIECSLLNQIAYFIGTFPIFHSTLYSDDVFKTTFITKTNADTYKYISASFDYIVDLEDHLSKLLYTLSNNNDSAIVQKLNEEIENTKGKLSQVILETQERIITECFNFELSNAKDLDALEEIKIKLLNFKKVLIQNDNYDFYNIFTNQMLGKIEEKENFINTYGIKSYIYEKNLYLPMIVNKNYGISLFTRFFTKLKKLAQSQGLKGLLKRDI